MPPPDPIWIDANVAVSASSGNKPIEAELIRLRKAGHRLLMPQAAWNEFFYGNPLTERHETYGHGEKVPMDLRGKAKPTHMLRPSAATRAQRQIWLSNMRIYPDSPQDVGLTHAERVAQMEGGTGISPSDARVLGQIRSSAAAKAIRSPVLLTTDAGPLVQAEHYGITARQPVPPASAPPSPAPGATVSVPAAKAAAATGGNPKPGSSAAPAQKPGGTGQTPKPGTSAAAPSVKPGADPTQNPSGPSAPASGPSTTTTPPTGMPSIPFRTRLLAGAKIVGGSAVSMLLMLIATWLRNQLAEIVIKGEIRLLEPVIRGEVEKRTEEVAHLQVNGSKAYANVTIGIVQTYAGGVAQGMPKVSLDGIGITGHEVNHVGNTPGPPPMWTLPWIQRTEHTYSFEMKVFSDEELEALASLSDLYMVYSRNLRTDPGSVHLKQQVKILRDQIVEQFGPKVSVLHGGLGG